MSRNVSANFWRAARMDQTDEDIHLILTLMHKDLYEPIRVVTDTVALISNGLTYHPFPFEFVLPQEDEAVPRGKLRFQNIDRSIGQSVLNIKDDIRCNVACVLRSDPDIEEFSYKYFYLRNCQGNSVQIEADISGKNYSTLIYPNVKASKQYFPGLYPQ